MNFIFYIKDINWQVGRIQNKDVLVNILERVNDKGANSSGWIVTLLTCYKLDIRIWKCAWIVCRRKTWTILERKVDERLELFTS